MKTLFLTVTLLTSFLVCRGQDTIETLEIRTTGLDTKDFVAQAKKTFAQYITRGLEADKLYRLKVLSTNDTVSIVRSPQSEVLKLEIDNRVTPFAGKELDIRLRKNETIDYEVTVENKTSKNTFKYFISLSTELTYNPNCNFIFLSAIRSVAGKPQTNEFFDLNLKFNYLHGTMFTLFSLDLSLSPADSAEISINEGMATANVFIHSGQLLASGELARALFFGVGLKAFNQQPYLGVHAGSLEINGPLFSSYLMAGYYYNAYGRYALVEKDNEAVNFRNNFYSECALAFDNKKNVAGILSDIRIKLGIMFPFTNSDNDIVKPLMKDVQYRLVLEVPIGGIYKFGGLGQKTLRAGLLERWKAKRRGA